MEHNLNVKLLRSFPEKTRRFSCWIFNSVTQQSPPRKVQLAGEFRTQ